MRVWSAQYAGRALMMEKIRLMSFGVAIPSAKIVFLAYNGQLSSFQASLCSYHSSSPAHGASFSHSGSHGRDC